MLACLNHTFNLPNRHFSAARIACHQSTDPNNSEPPQHQPRKLKTSPQLDRWSRARSLRSGRKLDRAGAKSTPVVVADDSSSSSASSVKEIVAPEMGKEINDERGGGDDVDLTAKSIYMVSDGTGWTAEHAVNAALGQFEHCLVDRNCSVNTHLFSGIEDTEQLMEVIKQAAKEGAMVVFTLADPSMSESAQKACKLWGIPSTDILSPITEAIALHLGVSPLGLPRGAAGRTSQLSDEYFARIEAIEFTIKQVPGALPQNLAQADIVLAGVSRTGKTPLSIYLAQKGYKVANVPLVKDVPVPKTLFEVDPLKVFGMTINPVVLQGIRRARAKGLGFDTEVRTNYSEMDYVREELDFAPQNPVWPVIGKENKMSMQ